MTTWMAEGAHQVTEVTVHHVLGSGVPAQAASAAGVVWPEGTPVRLRYGWWADDDGDVYGYVASSNVLASEDDPTFGHAVVLPVVYTLVGPSMPMQSHSNRLWADVTASWIARELAWEHDLQPAVAPSSTRFPNLMQQSSDWNFLAGLTDRIGYRLFLDGTTLWYVPRSTAMPTADGSIPQLTHNKTPGVINSIRQFKAIVGDTDPAGGVRATYQTTAFNRASSVTTPATFAMPRTDVRGTAMEPLVSRQYATRPAHSYTEAETLLSSDTVYLWVEARLIANGDPRLRPGCLVELHGDGLGAQNTGLWMVRSAVHRVVVSHADPTKTDYTATLVLGRNNAQTLDLPPTSTLVRLAPTVLVGGKWRAQSTREL
jgi:hypothetical protein